MMSIKKVFLVLLLMCAVSVLHAQEFYIKGHVVSGKQGIDFANVVLQKSDSSFVTGCIADKAGYFRIEGVKTGDYRICFSSIGYANQIIPLSSFSCNTDLGNVALDSVSVNLKEVVVTASHVINTPDKKIVLPSAYQVKASTNGIELLNQLHLSRLRVDALRNTVSSTLPGDVQLRINGAKADIQQIKALRPEDIMRVEYHDDPSMRYGENVAVVIDYITKRFVSGGYIGLDLMNSPFRCFGDNSIVAKYNHYKSEVGVNFYVHYRNLYGYWRKNSETFNFDDGTSFTRKEDGIPSEMTEDQLPVSFYYNYKEGNKWFINTTLYTYYSKSKINTRSVLYPEKDPNNSVDMTDYQKNNSVTPSLDIYFQRNYGKRQTLILDLVTTYINTKNRRNYKEDKAAATLTDIYSRVNGNKYSVIGEAIYEKGFGKSNTLSIGSRYFQSYTNNNYLGTVTTTTDMREGRWAGYAEFKGRLNRFNYSTGSYVAYFWTRQGDNSYHRTVVYPQIKLGYSFSDNLNVRYSGRLSYNTPSLSNLSDVSQMIDSLQIRRGNPNLKVSHTWSHYLSCDWTTGLLNVNGGIFYMYQGNPVMEETLRENNKFIRTTLNQRSWQKLNPELDLTFGPVKKILTLSVSGGMNYFDSKGVDYHHQYTNWYCSASASAVYKNFIAEVNVQSHNNDFYGETLQYGENYHMLALKYKYKEMSFGVAAFNPFVGKNSYKRPSENWNHYAYSSNTWYLRESSRLFLATFSWNISFGRKYDAGSKRVNNSDKESGTMSTSK